MSDAGVSVILPVWNVAGFVGEALASVRRQDGPIREIIVVDDGSDDGTPEAVRAAAAGEPRLRMLASDRRGPSGARNVGLAAATQPLIAFLDGDDTWPAGKIASQCRRLAAADRPDAVSGLIERFVLLDPVSLRPAGPPGAAMPHVNVGACLFRRTVFDRIGGFDESLRQVEDFDLLFRLREAGLKLVIRGEVALYYRIRPGSLTETAANAQEQEASALAVLRRSIARRRDGGGPLELPAFHELLEP
ncbi:MAG: glycosyltransferase family A protein [Dongiaceae bacterium]